ncbi:hypothetical protein L873DRAFT_1912930 [Choiromyces venosus 120613-1]|uniref:Uncharacterized protein n=1 Tax=Choiromyces venosus 120613-1 TaxID=1336337 RepID=A0A3N4JJP7_9PEZI|nr:hypothetical protein L873DRAFT_1912930 [Choiromyces venosus 120613-1]
MDSQASSTSPHKGKGKKKPCTPPDPTTPPQGTRWTTIAGDNTTSSLTVILDQYLVGASPDTTYFQNLYVKVAVESSLQILTPTSETVIFCKMLDMIHNDYRNSITILKKHINGLVDELDELWQQTPPPPEQPTTTTAPPDTHRVPESTLSTTQTLPPLSAPALAAISAPSWATVVRKGKKKALSTSKPASAAKLNPLTNAPTSKKGITMRERRLIIKHDGSPLTPIAMEVQDAINRVLSSTYIQTISLMNGNVTITTMESVKATSHNSRAFTFLRLILGATTVHLDTPATQLLVHGLPTTHSLALPLPSNPDDSPPMHPVQARMPPLSSSPSPAPMLPSLSISDFQPSLPHSGLSDTYGSMPSLSIPTVTTSDNTVTSVPAYPHATGVPYQTPWGSLLPHINLPSLGPSLQLLLSKVYQL